MKLKAPSAAASTLTVLMAALVATTMFAQQLSTASADDQSTTRLVAQMVQQYHISQDEIDDTISAKLLDKYIRTLDPQKLYFFESDVEFYSKRYRTKLDDALKQGQVDFAYGVFEQFRKRLDEQMELAHKWIDAEHDFTVDEEMMSDADDMTWVKTRAEMDDRWRKWIKYNLLTLKIDDVEPEEAKERLHKRYRTIARAWQQEEKHETLEKYLTAMAECFDPHSSYMSPQTLEDFQINMRLSLDGIGAALRSEDGMTTVAQIVPGGAAEVDGRLKVGDKIIGVGQAEGEIVDVVEMKLSKVVRYIRGKRGTVVRLQVKTAEDNKTKIYEMTRQKIELKSQAVKGEIIETKDRIGKPSKVGVINIPSFYRDFAGAQRGVEGFKSTAVDVAKVLDDFNAKGVDAVVIDLRTNGGGALSEAIEVSGLFIDKGPVVQVKEQSGKVRSHDDVDSGVKWEGPLVVICNRLSASASEIFAGVIKDYNRGIVVGDTTTHGKGTVQNVMPVGRQMFVFKPQDRGALKLTIQQFYRVNGDSTQNRGVRSDVVLPSLIDHMDLGESFLDNALEFDRIPAATFGKLALVNPNIVSSLQKDSSKRVSSNEEFGKLQKEIEEYVESKKRRTVTLNEVKLRAEREARDDKKDDKKDDDKKDGADDEDKPVFPKGYYNDEVLQITVDYVNLLKQNPNTVSR